MQINDVVVERNGLKRWRRPPQGYYPLSVFDRVRAGDVQKISDNVYAEYPERGLLIGALRGQGGVWLRKSSSKGILESGLENQAQSTIIANPFILDRNGLKRWRHPPEGYYSLSVGDKIQALDVQKISDNLYAEYPERGLLSGELPSQAGVWLRRIQTP